MTRATRVLGISCLFLLGCAGGDKPSAGTDGGTRCVTDSDCDDSIACTVDSCGAGNACRNMALDALCADGETCSVARGGCSASADCASDTDCDDAIDCTLDSCNVDMTCRYMPVDALCGAGESCDATLGCVAGSGCTTDADCDDSIDCTVDRCAVGNVCAHEPVDALCADGETCSETSGCFTPMPCETADDCQDGNFCNGAEVCMPEFGCAPAPAPRMCDDSDDCTVDTCDATEDRCVFACDSSRAECMCETVEAPCAGTFMISPVPSQTCACDSGGACQVDYDVMQATFSCVGDVLSVSLGVPSATLDSALTQMPRPTDSTFDVATTIPGGDFGCTEYYRLTGRFTDADTFTATFSAMYPGVICSFGGCANQSIMVTGTRI